MKETLGVENVIFLILSLSSIFFLYIWQAHAFGQNMRSIFQTAERERERERETEAEMERIRRDREQEAASTSEKRRVFSQLTFILCGFSLAHPYL